MDKKQFSHNHETQPDVFGSSPFGESGSSNFANGKSSSSISNTGSFRKITPPPENHTYRIAKIVLSFATGILILILFGVIFFLVRDRFFPPSADTHPASIQIVAQAPASSAAEAEQSPPVDLTGIQIPPLSAIASLQSGIGRFALIHTTIPTRPRTNVISYSVAKGDNLFLIGERYGIKPETVLWSNVESLNDNPRMLKIGQELNILPIDGSYHKWKKDDNLRKVAESFKVDPMVILEYAGNRFDLSKATVDEPGIKPDTWIIVPGGKRPVKDWGPPAITRTNPAVAKYYGDGSCGKILTGAVGNGTFVWPVPSNHTVSGYDYTEIHAGIDIGGSEGAPIAAADSGVVVFAGWSNFGYGQLLVIDHGNGWQTAYGHLNAIGATCGQSVIQGGTVATLGNTGNSSGPHLHFEMKFNGAPANPHDFVQ